MKKRIIYLMLAAMGTVGFYSCGPSQGTTGTGTNDTPTEGTRGNTGGTTETPTGTTGTGDYK